MKELDELIDIIAKLRDPEQGCQWDLKQTHESLVPNFIEEMYEVVEAIEASDKELLCEELGDLLLHIAMQARIAEEHGDFTMAEICLGISQKIVRRHPHIFGTAPGGDANQVKQNWERIKLIEKKQTRLSVLEGIPKSLPALILAWRTQEKAASVGFDWPDEMPVFDKMKEEELEFLEAWESKDQAKMQEELGDMLFTIVNLARKLNIDAEAALRQTTQKFERRFQQIESFYRERGEQIHDRPLEELDQVWDAVKKTES